MNVPGQGQQGPHQGFTPHRKDTGQMATHKADPNKTHRLMIDFDNAEAMADFLDEFMDLIRRHLPDDAPDLAVWESDALDYNPKNGGVGRKQSFIVKPADDGGRFLGRFEYQRVRSY